MGLRQAAKPRPRGRGPLPFDGAFLAGEKTWKNVPLLLGCKAALVKREFWTTK